jgi:rRNA maturation RNase YbeY
MNEFCVRNRQRHRYVNSKLLQEIARAAFDEAIQSPVDAPRPRARVGVHLVSSREITRLNQKHLRHQGSTDVITFHYGQPEDAPEHESWVHGDIVVCLDEAVTQAAAFKSTWPCELVRYIVHGLLHLLGYDDTSPSARKIMKREENRLVRALARSFPISQLAHKPKLP